MADIIYLQKVGKLNKSMLFDLKKNLEENLIHLNISVDILQDKIKLKKGYFDSERGQYIAHKILNFLNIRAQNMKYFRIIGVLNDDMYTKNYNFVFGLAKMNNRSALISIARLREEFYLNYGTIHRKIESYKKLEERILKEAIHELGHTFGLEHCINTCIMQFSNNLIDTDNKPKEFCDSCRVKLQRLFNIST